MGVSKLSKFIGAEPSCEGATGWPHYDDAQIAAVERVLRSGKVNYWTGEEGRQFETEFAAYCGAGHAVAVSNGTVALELALQSLSIGPGDEVIVTPRSFFASASCVVQRGAKPVFADIDCVSQNIDPDAIEPLINSRTKAIIVVHLAGWPCEMDRILELAARHGAHVIEDCAQAHGASFRGRKVGGWGHIAAFSFCQDKIMTTGGEGGMLLTSDPALFERLWTLKDHGKNRRKMQQRNGDHGFRWVHDGLGTNARMTEMQAAIGRVQLGLLDRWVELRRRNAAVLDRCVADIAALESHVPPAHVGHAYYKYYAFLRLDRLRQGWTRDRIVAQINSRGVRCFSGSCPEIYLEQAFQTAGLAPHERLPRARSLADTSLMFQVHPTLSGEDMLHACEAIAAVMSEAEI
jgi:dTDP-4-amino-4,6-dideoxygalactose transaminase